MIKNSCKKARNDLEYNVERCVMIDGKLLIEKLIRYAVKFLHLNQRDVIYFRNILLREFKLDAPFLGEYDLSWIDKLDVPDLLVGEVEQYAKENSLVEEGLENLFSTFVFGLLSPIPSIVNQTFRDLKEKDGIEKACAYLYDLSVKNNYVQKTAIGRNLHWIYLDGEKFLEITVNLSKPEKDNKDIAKLLTLKKSDAKYPECLLCKENEGYQGRANHPARENIRTISLTMGGEPWFVQYSPYAYYNEHMIAISESHTPMKINGQTLEKLLDFVDFFPNYMIGSNAALPIIGGSILNHEHFQGGEHLMPMHKCGVKEEYEISEYPTLKIGIADWYNSVIRLESNDRELIKKVGKTIIEEWENYSDIENEIISQTNETRHNSLSPVCRKNGNVYILDVILRNNRTSEEYPDGIFHAHPEYHNIKKEGIGLIEAMGLFILPGRLKKQLADIAQILCNGVECDISTLDDENNNLFVHRNMIKDLLKDGFSNSFEDAQRRVYQRVNETCKNILFNTAVFKDTKVGRKGFNAFMEKIGAKKRG